MRPRKKDRHLPAKVYQKHGAFYYVHQGKWERLGSTLEAALKEYAKKVAPRSGGAMPDLIDEVLRHISPNLASNTVTQYTTLAERLKKILAQFNPDQVLPRHVAAIKAELAGTPNMANRMLSFLRTVFSYAVEWQRVDANPCIGIRRHVEKKRERYITDDEFLAICAVSTENMRVIYQMAYLTGQRINDVLGIKLSDISDEGIAFKQQKTGKRLIVAMTPDIDDVITRTKALPRSARGLTLFTTRTTCKPVIYETVKQQFKKACERAGVKDATLHDLRAKAITDTKNQGNNPQLLAGHSDPRMTDRYIRLREIDIATGPALSRRAIPKQS
ncbi:phage integrase family protein [Pseudomonas knackmussii B13]|uniref:Phage integrase family protein n=1 Tax=Pseudomonas knackmussii (strain DSM 6978 / CCUG 54928 / LMG 23759 / B13) TaxID=1301098 RepID=A0A024HDU8_PSEKB|nr:tyrosine-type recombinase/integrase [Pseudomonas knackmussii]CDF82618.1 phage integrase family protein [Pseudomonas knackmussii B13]